MSLLNSKNTLLVSDWDGTIAVSDTLALISPSPEALKPYTKAYMDDMEALSAKFGPRNTLDRMKQWLEAMQTLEYDSVHRVEQGGLFKGMARASLLERARDTTRLSVQAGSVEFLKSFQGQWGVVSVGWSAAFIRAALESRGVDLSNSNIKIFANEVEFDNKGIGTGKISKHEGNAAGIRIAADKLREMRRMVESWKQQDPENTGGIVVYVGDSETDLLCLLEADVGVIMNSKKLEEQCKSMNLQVSQGLDNLPGKKSISEAYELRTIPNFLPFSFA